MYVLAPDALSIPRPKLYSTSVVDESKNGSISQASAIAPVPKAFHWRALHGNLRATRSLRSCTRLEVSCKHHRAFD